MKRHHGLLLTLIQISLTSALPRHPRNSGVSRHHGSPALVDDNVLVYDEFSYSPSSEVSAIQSLQASGTSIPTDAASIAAYTTSSALAVTATNVLTYTETTSCKTDYNGNPVLPTSSVSVLPETTSFSSPSAWTTSGARPDLSSHSVVPSPLLPESSSLTLSPAYTSEISTSSSPSEASRLVGSSSSSLELPSSISTSATFVSVSSSILPASSTAQKTPGSLLSSIRALTSSLSLPTTSTATTVLESSASRKIESTTSTGVVSSVFISTQATSDTSSVSPILPITPVPPLWSRTSISSSSTESSTNSLSFTKTKTMTTSESSTSSTSRSDHKTSSSTTSSSSTLTSTKTHSTTSSKTSKSTTSSTSTSEKSRSSKTSKSSTSSCTDTTTSTSETITTKTKTSTEVKTSTIKSKSTPSTTLTTTSQTLSTSTTLVTSPTRRRKSSKKPKTRTSSISTTQHSHSLPPSSTISLTLATTLTISEVQTLTSTTTLPPVTTGTLITTLVTHNQNTLPPFKSTLIPEPSTSIRPITTGTRRISRHLHTMSPTAPLSNNIFVPIATGPPPSQITTNPNYPEPPIDVDQDAPLETNKFYFNFFLGTRNAPAWTHPYSVAWAAGGGAAGSWGLSISQIPRSETVFGPGSPPSYYTNPIGIQSIILSARELGGSTDMSVDHLEGMSCHVNLAPASGAAPVITFPLIQGMGFITGVYNSGTPFIQSSVFFQTLTYTGLAHGNTARYSVLLTDGTTWLIYLTAEKGSSIPTLTLASSGEIIGSSPFSGSVQVAKIPEESSVGTVQSIYDASAGVYAVNGHVSASVKGSEGTYQLSWSKGGEVSRTLLMFALPHHVQSFRPSFKNSAMKSVLQLDTTTKGTAIAVQADAWNLYHDDIPEDMGFAPWRATTGSQKHISESAINLIQSVAAEELAENIGEQTNLNSMYYAGKGFAKFAFTVYAANDMAGDRATASAGLVQLEEAFSLFINNQQIYPLVYDPVWGGVVSSCTYETGDWGCDFGNTLYNDHHFHYGYFVYTAAVIGYLDPSWLEQGTNKDWINTLIRDYANPVSDEYFPFQRMFDWYNGHSWAAGIIESYDGKNQESSSEDAFSSYAIKMWGRTIGDANMEARGNLMLAVQATSLQDYYLMQTNNTVEPPIYLPNKASGILFDNKIDHTTYFGTNIEYIEGIHMIPVNPSSALTRDIPFVQQEWDTYFASGYVDTIESGWRGILMANLAIIDPVTAYNFFAQPDFNPIWLDPGASRTWYLALCAGWGGSPA